MRITYVDGLGTIGAKATYNISISPGVGQGAIGINLNSTSAAPTNVAYGVAATSSFVPMCVPTSFFPTVGLNFLQAMEAGDGSDATTWTGQMSLAALTVNVATMQAWLDM